MRWLLTDNVPDLAAALRGAGHAVVSNRRTWLSTVADAADADYAPNDFRLDTLLAREKPDVCVLVDLVRVPGVLDDDGRPVQCVYNRSHVSRWRARRRLVIGFSRTDPGTWGAFQRNRVRACSAKPNDCGVWVTTSAGTAAAAKARQRAVHWTGPDSVGAVLAAVTHALEGKAYNATRDGRLW